MTKVCSLDGCENRSSCHGYCTTHYARWYRGKDLTLPIRRYGATPRERFENKVVKTDGCWFWRGATIQSGYGVFAKVPNRGRKKMVLAHRFAYELVHCSIPDGLHIDHLCSNRLCVKPAHLEAVTQAENNRRSHDRRKVVPA